MRKVEVCRKITDLESKKQMTLIYSITVDLVSDTATGAELENFGVSISIDEIGEETSVRGITLSDSRIRHLADLLATNLVTPVTLQDIVYDWL